VLFPRDQFASCGLETPHYYFGCAFKKFVAKGEVIVPMLPQHYPRKTNCSACLRGARIKMPEIRRDEPGPSQRFTSRNSIDNDRLPITRFSLEHNASSLD
jgi:hypothetical protein